jgi:hypothetical protein
MVTDFPEKNHTRSITNLYVALNKTGTNYDNGTALGGEPTRCRKISSISRKELKIAVQLQEERIDSTLTSLTEQQSKRIRHHEQVNFQLVSMSAGLLLNAKGLSDYSTIDSPNTQLSNKDLGKPPKRRPALSFKGFKF